MVFRWKNPYKKRSGSMVHSKTCIRNRQKEGEETHMHEKHVKNVMRGDIFYCELSPAAGKGSLQGGARPVLIVQNNIGNKYSPTTIVVPLTSRVKQTDLPTHVILNPYDVIEPIYNFTESIILCEQILTVDKRFLERKIGSTDLNIRNKVNKALATSISLNCTCANCTQNVY